MRSHDSDVGLLHDQGDYEQELHNRPTRTLTQLLEIRTIHHDGKQLKSIYSMFLPAFTSNHTYSLVYSQNNIKHILYIEHEVLQCYTIGTIKPTYSIYNNIIYNILLSIYNKQINV